MLEASGIFTPQAIAHFRQQSILPEEDTTRITEDNKHGHCKSFVIKMGGVSGTIIIKMGGVSGTIKMGGVSRAMIIKMGGVSGTIII